MKSFKKWTFFLFLWCKHLEGKHSCWKNSEKKYTHKILQHLCCLFVMKTIQRKQSVQQATCHSEGNGNFLLFSAAVKLCLLVPSEFFFIFSQNNWLPFPFYIEQDFWFLDTSQLILSHARQCYCLPSWPVTFLIDYQKISIAQNQCGCAECSCACNVLHIDCISLHYLSPRGPMDTASAS